MPAPQTVFAAEVQFYDTDCGGVAHNLAYLRFIEAARTRLTSDLGFDAARMTNLREFPTLLRTEVDYRRPAVLGDRLEVRGELASLGKVRFRCAFEIHRPADGALLVTCRQQLALIRMPEGNPLRVPGEWFERFPDLPVE